MTQDKKAGKDDPVDNCDVVDFLCALADFRTNAREIAERTERSKQLRKRSERC
jgi:hypothetical protein